MSIARNFTIICTRAVGTRPSLAVFLKEQRQRALNGRCVARNKRIFATAAAAAATVSTFEQRKRRRRGGQWWKTEHKRRAGIRAIWGFYRPSPIALKVGFRQIFSVPDSSIGYLVTNLLAPTGALYAMLLYYHPQQATL